MAEEFDDKLMTVLLILVPKQKKKKKMQICIFFQVRSSVSLTSETGTQKCACQWEKNTVITEYWTSKI